MLFTEGEDVAFELMMQEVPRPSKRRRKYEDIRLRGPTIEERDCPNCMHYDSRRKQCKKEKCVVFDT